MSRARNILISSKGIPTKDPIADLIGLKLGGASVPVVDITGNLPLSFNAKRTSALTNYRIYGTENVAGVETENLFDYTAQDPDNGFSQSHYLFYNGGTNSSSNYNISEYIEVLPNTEYTISSCVGNTPSVCEYNSNKTFIVGTAYGEAGTISFSTTATTNYIRISVRKSRATEMMLIKGSTAPASYIPFGYQIPLTNTSGEQSDTYPLYIGSTKLSAEEYVDYREQKVYKRNPASFLWFQVFAYPQSDKRFLYSIAWTEEDRPNLQSDIGFVALRGQEQIITHETAGVSVIGIDQERISDYLYSSGMIRDLGEGCNFRTFVKVGDEYFYGENLHITYDEVVAAPAEEILLDRPAVVLPHDPPAPLPEITAYKGENTLSSTETVGSVTVRGRISEIPEP